MVLGLPDPWLHVLDAFQEHLDRERRHHLDEIAGGKPSACFNSRGPGPDTATSLRRSPMTMPADVDADAPRTWKRCPPTCGGGRARERRRRRARRLPRAAGSRSSSTPGTSRISSVEAVRRVASAGCSRRSTRSFADFDGAARRPSSAAYRGEVAGGGRRRPSRRRATCEPGLAYERCRRRPGAGRRYQEGVGRIILRDLPRLMREHDAPTAWSLRTWSARGRIQLRRAVVAGSAVASAGRRIRRSRRCAP